MAHKALLMILDGWGIGNHTHSNAIYSTPTPYWDSLVRDYPHSQLQASGENVGLPDGQMGNSEVGHLNIGAGRVLYQDLVKINKAIESGSIQVGILLRQGVRQGNALHGTDLHRRRPLLFRTYLRPLRHRQEIRS